MGGRIVVRAEVFDGNLGNGWVDNETVAESFAVYMASTWRAELAELKTDGYALDVCVSPVLNASGCAGEPVINVGDGDDWLALMERVECLITDKNTLWERWCRTNEADALARPVARR